MELIQNMKCHIKVWLFVNTCFKVTSIYISGNLGICSNCLTSVALTTLKVTLLAPPHLYMCMLEHVSFVSGLYAMPYRRSKLFSSCRYVVNLNFKTTGIIIGGYTGIRSATAIVEISKLSYKSWYIC